MVGFLFGELIEERSEVEGPGNINRCSPKSGLPLCFTVSKNLGGLQTPKLNLEHIGESPSNY
jgi:hypothetical protein